MSGKNPPTGGKKGKQTIKILSMAFNDQLNILQGCKNTAVAFISPQIWHLSK